GGRGRRERPAHPVQRPGVPGARLARARDVRLLRDHLRRAPGPGPDRDARRLARSPPAQGLPAGRYPGGVQGREHPAARRAEVVQLMTDSQPRTGTGERPPYASPHIVDEAAEGVPTFEAAGGDWSEIA